MRGGLLLALLAALTCATARAEGDAPPRAFRDCADCPEMVALRPGTFRMGAGIDEERRELGGDAMVGREGPPRDVRIRKGFAMARHEVTRGEYAVFARATGRRARLDCEYLNAEFAWTRPGGLSWERTGLDQDSDHPVLCVSWDDAAAYAAWLARATGKPYRLPSEAEWEYAARAGTTGPRYWGDDLAATCINANGVDRDWQGRRRADSRDAVCADGHAGTAPVGRFQPNAFGLRDMLGNAAEWVADCWHPTHAGAPDDGAARLDGDCGRRVAKGGSWNSAPELLRAASRLSFAGGGPNRYTGFRLARDLPDIVASIADARRRGGAGRHPPRVP
ncbi:MAG: formylglycine-generating enzyme family protein [Rhodospirillales bacterium]|nr:MAG: formylglycine-generating enzyme family protein [Rhodospirillales bacterium]